MLDDTDKTLRKFLKWMCVTFILLLPLCCFFYRFPVPIIRYQTESEVYSPAFGKVLKIIRQENNSIFISIFLNPLDVHYQYYPVSGKVVDLQYDCTGKFALAYDLNKSQDNEKYITTIRNNQGDFKIYQIAGYFVRRINNNSKISKLVECGEVMGLIHFGSRVDIIIPNAEHFTLNVKEDDKVRGFNTCLGYYKE